MSNMVIGAVVAPRTRGGRLSSLPNRRHRTQDLSAGSKASFLLDRGKDSRSFAASLFSLATAAALCTGCANPGPPRPPSLHLPALVGDLTAERTGNRVLLRWTTFSRTTDDLDLKGPMMAQICREAGPRPGTATARAAACAPVLRLAVSPGPSEVADTLPVNLCSDPVRLLTYRVQVLNSSGRSAGDSTAAFAAAGTAPLPLESFQATAENRGTFLAWNTDPAAASLAQEVEFARTDLSARSAAKAPAKPNVPAPRPRRPARQNKEAVTTPPSPSPNVVRLRTPQYPSTAAQDSATQRPEVTDGLLDTTALFGSTYSYSGQRVRSVAVGQRSLEIRSEPSNTVDITLRDIFPPRRPSGLATIPSGDASTPYVDLSWEPNSEPDLAGYFVYRQLAGPDDAPQGMPRHLTPTPVTAPAYRDVAVSPGQRYIYWVTAVDASGNESAPSAKAQEVVTPNRRQ